MADLSLSWALAKSSAVCRAGSGRCELTPSSVNAYTQHTSPLSPTFSKWWRHLQFDYCLFFFSTAVGIIANMNLIQSSRKALKQIIKCILRSLSRMENSCYINSGTFRKRPKCNHGSDPKIYEHAVFHVVFFICPFMYHLHGMPLKSSI